MPFEDRSHLFILAEASDTSYALFLSFSGIFVKNIPIRDLIFNYQDPEL